MGLRKTQCVLCGSATKPLFCFPKDPRRMKTWLSRLCLDSLINMHNLTYIYNNGRLCGLHFHKDAFNSSLKTRLLKFALPIDLRGEETNTECLADLPPDNELPTTSLDASLDIPLSKSVDQSMEREISLHNLTEENFIPPHHSSLLDHSYPKTQIHDNTANTSTSSPCLDLVLTSTPVHPPSSIVTPKTKEISRLRSKVSKMKKKLFSGDKLLQYMYKVLPQDQYKFICSQIRLGKIHKKGRRWSPEEKAFAYSIYQQSSSAYAILRKHLAFPCKNTLKKSIGNIAKDVGFCPVLFRALLEKAKKLPENEKFCTLVFDEMAIKSHLSYNASLDIVDGFDSTTSDVDKRQFATQALVFMIRGITDNWKQVIAYYFRGNSCPDGWFKSTLIDVLDKIHTCGFTVVAVVCDQGPNNRALFRDLGVSSEKPFFCCNGRKIYAMYDVPHLIKSVRNNLKNYNVQYPQIKDGKIGPEILTASWKDIEELYHKDKGRYYKVAPKLTKEHVFARGLTSMKVKLATQVFSRSVAVGLEICSEANSSSSPLHTANFVGTMNDIFDSMNSKSEFGEGTSCAISENTNHMDAFKTWIKWIDSWKFIGPRQNDVRPPCQNGLILSIKSIMGVWEELKESVPHLKTNRLNQDCIENTFSSVRRRGGFRDNPNSQEFRSAIRAVIVHNFMKGSKGKNCEDDFDYNLIVIDKENVEPFTIQEEENIDEELVTEEEIPTPTHVEENVIAYVSGVISHVILNKNPCTDCEGYLVGPKTIDHHTILLYYKEFKDTHTGLKWPTVNFYSYVLQLSNCFFKHIDFYFKRKNVRTNLCSVLKDINFDFFEDHCHKEIMPKHIVHVFVTMMLKHKIRMYNSEKSSINVFKKLKNVKNV